MLLVANLFWGLSFPAAKTLLLLNGRLVPGGSGWFSILCTVAPRFALAAPMLALFVPGSRTRPTRAEWAQGLAIGLFAAGGLLLQTDGLRFTAASTSAFLTQFYAIMIPVWVALRTGRNPGIAVWGSCVLVMAGAAILGHFDWRTLRFGRGEWETLLCSVFFMGVIFQVGKKEHASNRPLVVTLVMFGTEAVIFTGLAAWTAPAPAALVIPWTSPAWIAITLILTIFCTFGSFTLMNVYQPRITATEAGLIYCFEPIFGAFFALILPALFSRWSSVAYRNEHATASLLTGGVLITAANLLIQLGAPTTDA